MAHIWIRDTVDWADEQAFLAQMPADLGPKVELWNATFTLPFHLFRHRVREIAAGNLACVEDAVVAGWDEIPDGALVLPVDDDDWFAPGVAAVLEAERDPAASGCYWTSRWIEVPYSAGYRAHLARRRMLPWTAPKFTLGTNNYALVKSGDTAALCGDHVVATRWLDAGGPMTRIDRSLSVTNRTLASRTTLHFWRSWISRAGLLRKFRGYRTLYDGPAPPDLAWSDPYREQMAGLMREVELR